MCEEKSLSELSELLLLLLLLLLFCIYFTTLVHLSQLVGVICMLSWTLDTSSRDR
jgi:hypothetical protein